MRADELERLLPPDVLDAAEAFVAQKVHEEIARILRGSDGRASGPSYSTSRRPPRSLRCDEQRIYDLVTSGRLPKLKDGSRVLVRRNAVEAYLAGGVSDGAGPAVRRGARAWRWVLPRWVYRLTAVRVSRPA